MKYLTKKESQSFLKSVFSSDLFKKQIEKNDSALNKIILEASKYPISIYQMKDLDFERSNFTSWVRCLSLKNYENIYIQDLYYLHEILHIATMTFLKNDDFDLWCQKMSSNEARVSLFTEVLVYFEIPELRPNSFKDKIWADYFLTPENISLYKENPSKIIKRIYKQRLKAYKNPQNKEEEQIAYWGKRNSVFFNVWKNDYLKVEKSMASFLTEPKEVNQIKILKNLHAQFTEHEIIFYNNLKKFLKI